MLQFFFFSIIAMFCWSGSDIFSKIGTDQKDKNSQWRVVFAVGIIMGLHLIITLIGGSIVTNPDSLPKAVAGLIYTDFRIMDFVYYLPIATIYIVAMVVGYKGLRYIELSVSSPICNSSGSLALLICGIIGLFVGGNYVVDLSGGSIAGVVLVAVGIIALGIVEYKENDEAREMRQSDKGFHYTRSIVAILIPVLYLFLDALGTVGDQILAVGDWGIEISDYAANSAFELTFLCFALIAFIILKSKKEKILFKKGGKNIFQVAYLQIVKKQKMEYLEGEKDFNRRVGFTFLGGLCETVGQIFYMAVMFSDFDVGMVIISAYCAISVLWSRIFLKEKLSLLHYLTIAVVFSGIVLLGIFSPV